MSPPNFERGLLGAQAVGRELRRALAKLLSQDLAAAEILDRARKLILRYEPALARTLRDSLLAAWLQGARRAARPLTVPPEVQAPALSPSLPPPFGPAPDGEEPVEPVVRFPIIERAARSLFNKGLFKPADFHRLDQDALRTAFTVARVQSLEAIDKVKRTLIEDIAQGGTLRDFEAKMQGVITNALSPAQIETVYRTHVGQAYAQGLREVLDHPLVHDEFPFLMWTAIHDSRVEASHLAMEKFGLDGTAVFWADDPMWLTLTPPVRWNCRCAIVPLNIEDAAGYGVHAAKVWLRTGREPAHQWARKPYPITPPANWPTLAPGRIAAVA